MSSRIRGKETSIRLAVDGQDQRGSFLKVLDWEVTPNFPIQKQQFCGEDRPDGDVEAQGYDGKFRIHTLSSDAADLLDLIDANEVAHLDPPKYVITVYKKFRGTGAGDSTLLYTDIVLTCTSERGAGSDYVSTEWSFYAKHRRAL